MQIKQPKSKGIKKASKKPEISPDSKAFKRLGVLFYEAASSLSKKEIVRATLTPPHPHRVRTAQNLPFALLPFSRTLSHLLPHHVWFAA